MDTYTNTTDKILFRKAIDSDIERIWEIILQAKAQMKRLNTHQWDDNYPAVETIQNDIKAEVGYVLCKENRVMAYGVVSFKAEPAYDTIEGEWTNELPYLIVHRLAVADEVKGQGMARLFMQEAEEVSREKGIYNFRVDTKFDNEYMLRLIDKLGFRYSGEVYYRGNQARKAFEKCILPHTRPVGTLGHTIREVVYEDAADIYEAIDKNREDLRVWLPFVDSLKSIEDEQGFLKSFLELPYEQRDPVFIIKEGDNVCGLIGFHFSDSANHRTEIGYWLLPAYRGNGLVTNAVRDLCDWAFNKRNINRIQIRCAVGNAASNAIPLKLKFAFEGTERDGELLIDSKYTDIHVYSLLKKDYN